ncbi:DNA integrity scanning protein DisA [Candidatus Pacearchaeota archaeon]|nr:MAG: DNA integrity scanning protein DisA [Candidatus Pacearchaeota archaeon]
MVEQSEKSLIDALKFVSPGTSLRVAINDLVRSGLGTMIVFDSPRLKSENMLDGGFKINCRLTSQRLFELAKMDGAIIISNDLKKILYANVTMTPSSSIHSNETGTRHKAAERVARQAQTTVVTVSERRKKITVYSGTLKYTLKTGDELRNEVNSNIQLLEKQREILNEALSNLNILEMSDLVSVGDACKVIQRTRMILKISESLKKSFIELGKEGSIIHMRYRELIRGVEKIEKEILRDYSKRSLKKSKTIISNLTYEGLLDLGSISRLLIEKLPEDPISPRGFRFLSHLKLQEKEVLQIVKKFGNLKNILEADSKDFEDILKNRTEAVYSEIHKLREQILSGKVIC